jgi:tetratricopeptide (TPR) repeat protein
MTSFRNRLLAAAVTAATLGAAGAALAQGSGVQALMEQATYWRGQSEPAQALRALERVLSVHPTHPAALAGAAQMQAELGNGTSAEDYLARLRHAAPEDAARIAQAEQAVRRVQAPITTSSRPGRPGVGEVAVDRQRGVRALEAGQVAQAVQTFEQVLDRAPGDAGALGGLGVARLRQGRSAEAQDLLARAVAVDEAGGPQKWGRALDVAAFAGELARARQLLARGIMDAAETALLRAVRRETGERAEAEALLGDIALRRGDARGAEPHYRAALSRRPELPAAQLGLLETLQRQGRIAEAQDLAGRIGNPADNRANALRDEASRTEDPEAALALLRSARAADPANPWVRLDLARLLARQGQGTEGRALVEESIAGPSGADAIQAAALYAQEDGRFQDAVRLIERVPDRLRSADQTRLLRSLRIQIQVAASAGTAGPARPEEARRALLAMAGRPDPTGETAVRAVRALADLRDTQGASEAARLAVSANRNAPPALRITLAGTLLDAGLETEAFALARSLSAEERLSAAERRQVLALQGNSTPVAQTSAAPRRLALEERPEPAARPGPVLAEPPRLYQGARDPRVARRIAEAVLQRDPRNADARVGAIEAALALRDLATAETLLAEGRILNASDPRISVMESRLARASGDRRRAQTALRMAADQRRAQIGTDRGAMALAAAEMPYRRTLLAGDGQGASFVPLGDNPDRATSGGATSGQIRASDDPLLSEISRQLAEVAEEAAGRIVPTIAFRARSGDSGLERLREYGGGVEASTPLPNVGGRLSARVQGVVVDTDTLSPTTANLRRFGSNATVLPNGAAPISPGLAASLAPRDDSASGVSIGAAYARSNVTVDIGSSPLGFREQNIVGGIELTPQLSDTVRLRLRGERRSVTDSLLSWAGMRDTLSGRTFGGVTRNTAYGQLEYYSGDTGLYAGAGYSTFDGRGVADNSRYELAAGINHAIFRSPTEELVTGLDVNYYAYDKNLRFFTLGHGGYFSPQSYVAASVPVDYRERRGNLAFRIGGSVGVANFREKSSPYFPRDGALQAVVETQAAADPTISAFYPGQRETTFTAGLRGDIEYAITPSLRIGASARYDRSADFNETRGLIYARYRFDP